MEPNARQKLRSSTQKLDPLKRCRNNSTAGFLFTFYSCHRPLHKSQLEMMHCVNNSVRLTRWFSTGNSRAKLFIGGLLFIFFHFESLLFFAWKKKKTFYSLGFDVCFIQGFLMIQMKLFWRMLLESMVKFWKVISS